MNPHFEEAADQARKTFDIYTERRDGALTQARLLIRHCAHAIRAVHRSDRPDAEKELQEARELVITLREGLKESPQIFYAGYTQDAFKEYAEASLVFALIFDEIIPTPVDLELSCDIYLQGLAEANGELRRRCLDILRHGYSEEAERLMGIMDDIYGVLVTMDYSEAITGGLRRLTDIVRGINERTRADLTIILRQSHLEESIKSWEEKMENAQRSV